VEEGGSSDRTETVTVFLSFHVPPMQNEIREFAKDASPSAQWLKHERLTLGRNLGGGHAERYTGG
jgi:hypothetical protein